MHHYRWYLQNVPVHEAIEMNANRFCLPYTVARLIDRSGVFFKKFCFLPPYDRAATFDWRFEALRLRDRTFLLYHNGTQEEDCCPFAGPEAHRAASEQTARHPERQVVRSVKLLYFYFDRHPPLYSDEYDGIYQLDVMDAWDAEHDQYEIEPEDNRHVQDSVIMKLIKKLRRYCEETVKVRPPFKFAGVIK